MAPFRDSELGYTDHDGEQRERVDWSLLKNGPIALFFKQSVLDDAVGWLKANGYAVAEADCATCRSDDDLLRAIGHALHFEDWPNPGLDGFADDCRHIKVPDEGGLTLVLLHFDRLLAKTGRTRVAQQVLDILAGACRDQLLFGRRLIVLLQSDNPGLELPPVGGVVPRWNPREWLDSDRGG